MSKILAEIKSNLLMKNMKKIKEIWLLKIFFKSKHVQALMHMNNKSNKIQNLLNRNKEHDSRAKLAFKNK